MHKPNWSDFLKHVRFGYLFFTSLIILGIVYGGFEILEIIFYGDDTSEQTLRWLFVTRGVVSSLLLMVWAAWTVFQYRGMYEEQLESTEQRYRNVIESSNDAIVTLDEENHITTWNRGAEQIFGWKRSEVIGRPIMVIIPDDLIEEKENERIEARMRERGSVLNYETERLTKDGQRIPISLNESYIRDEKGRIVGRTRVMRDLTDLRIQEEHAQRSERLATVGHMAAGVAHEVGNPLTAISSMVQVLQRKSNDDFTQQQLKKIREHIQRISKIVRDLVDFSRPAGVEKSSANLNEIIRSAVGLMQHDARCRDVDFNLRLASNIPRIECIPDQIHQVIVNLLLNAVDAMQDTEIPKVEIRTLRNSRHAVIEVEDEGAGMSEEVKKRIFEPFYTTKEVGKGTGLGLSVSHGIISKLGGNIEVESVRGKGTRFVIKIPLKNS
ncbi:MAG: two-component system sensor histidine kinase NtrB [Balneolaceae bacterium]